MRKIPVEQAIGQILCHDMTAIFPDGYKGPKFKRGHQITAEDIPQLLDMGKSHIFVWEPNSDDVHEDDAGLAITEAVLGAHIGYKGPSEGKYQLIAEADGLFCVNRDGLTAINSVEDYTIASIPDLTAVQKGQVLAGARIVPLVTHRSNVEAAVRAARKHAPIFQVKPFRPLKTGVIITGNEVYYNRIQDGFQPVLTPKLERFGAQLLGFQKCPDDLKEILSAIQHFTEMDAQLILLTGGMSVDPDDLTPTAIRQSGAHLITQGVPMQPGNMLTMAYLDQTMLIGVPGASLHSPTTSLDVFLPRVFAGLRISRTDIAAMGNGGLCMGCKECRYPACYFGRS